MATCAPPARPGAHDAMKPAIGMLVFGYWDMLVNRARLKLPPSDVEDVASEAIASAIASAFDGKSVGEFRSWLHTILSRRIADYLEARKRRPQDREARDRARGSDDVWGEEPAEGFEGDALLRARVHASRPTGRSRTTPTGGSIDLHVLGPLSATETATTDRRRDDGGKRAPDRVALPEAGSRALRRRRYFGLSHDGRAATTSRSTRRHTPAPTRRAFLEQVSGRDRGRAGGADRRIPGASAAAAVRPGGFRDSPAAPRGGIGAALAGGLGGMWPSLLPRLRNQARLKRADLVRRAGGAARGRGAERQGRPLLPPDGAGPAAGGRGVRHRARGAGADRRNGAEALRKAGEMPAPGPARRTAARCSRAGPGCRGASVDGGRAPAPRPRSGTRSTACSAAADSSVSSGPLRPTSVP